MREISQETQEILKSQKMIGQNKFSYELMLEGYKQYNRSVIDNIISTWLENSSSGLSDIAVRQDGKILVVYKKGLSIYTSYAANENILLDNPSIILAENEQLIYTCASSKTSKNFALLRLKNGKILLFITDLGLFGDQYFKTIVMQSESGLGNDFALLTTMQSKSRIWTLTTYLNDSVGSPKISLNGDIFICLMGLDEADNNDFSVLNVYKSSDNGLTWLRIYQFNFYLSIGVWGARLSGITHINEISIIGDVLVCTFLSRYGSNQTISFYSINMGASWIAPSWAEPLNLNNLFPFNDPSIVRGLYSDNLNGEIYYLIYKPSVVANLIIYSMPIAKIDNISYLNNMDHWTKINECNIGNTTLTATYNFKVTNINNMFFMFVNGSKLQSLGMIRDPYKSAIDASSISISKGKGGANSLSLSVDNSNASINPKNPESALYNIINLNRQIIVKQGYGEDLIETFTGMIDSFSMISWPHTMEISCRDNLKKALDQTITEAGSHTINFETQPIENIFGYLCYLGGLEAGEIDATGISISKEFSWQTYADAFQFLADLASFDFGADEYGKIYFKRDYQPDEVFIAYTFEEGLDIISLSYQMEDKDLYYMVKVFGKAGENVISYSALFPDAAKYNILPQKILKVDATEASTIAELKMIADRSIYLMNSRTAIVNFAAVAVPWLQVGDFIQVNESSSMSAGIYRISSLNLKMNDKDFTMDLQCYYYGDSVDVGTLPENTATQTGNASLNLIPEMTSNIAPSGVARASSVLTLYDNDYQPWNALNSTSDDLYWNAVSQYGWIEYQFTEKTIIDKYMLKARQALDYNKAMPKNWQFEAFDGDKWIVLDTRSNQTAWQILEERSFDFTNAIAYAKYRLNVSANNGFHRLQLEQLAMYYMGGA